jgi:hypothetical protein
VKTSKVLSVALVKKEVGDGKICVTIALGARGY